MAQDPRPLSVTFTVDEVDQRLDVRQISGTEGISQLYSFQVEFTCAAKKELELSETVGKHARIAFEGLTKKPRYVHGVVHRVLKLGKGTRGAAYVATLVPDLFRLVLGQDCQIFQEKSMKQIVCELLDTAKIEHKFQCSEDQEPEKREYCVQYRESDWAFISRLLAEEGYAYFFTHERDRHVMQITNEPTIFPAIPAGAANVEFHSAETAHVTTEHISELYFSEEVCPDQVTLRDYNFEKPAIEVIGEAPKKAPSEPLEIYDYPGDFYTAKEGTGLAQLRLEQARATRVLGSGHGLCPRLTAGHHFVLESYPHGQLDPEDKYLLVSVSHHVERHDEGEGTPSSYFAYGNSFTCIPCSTPFRPRLPARPVVQGVHTARVVGPKKDSREEIHTDDQGRVKVLFHWDRKSRADKPDKYGSCWIRVSQIFAGPRMGAVFTPRVGDEVIVDFLEGDPDRPIITGRVYNGQNVPALGLPANKTQSTIKTATSPGGQAKGYNQIRFEDKKGSEELYVQAQKDMNELIKSCMSTSVGANQTLTVGKNRTKTVKEDESITVKGNRAQIVEKDESVGIRGSRTVNVDGAETVEVGGTRTVTIGTGKTPGDESLTVMGKRTKKVNKDETVTVVGKRTETVQKEQALTVTKKRTVTVGADDSLTVTGKLTQIAKNLVVKVAEKITAIGNKEVSISGQKVSISAKQELKIGVGSSAITIKPDGLQVSGAKITSTAVGPHEISGAIVKIN